MTYTLEALRTATEGTRIKLAPRTVYTKMSGPGHWLKSGSRHGFKSNEEILAMLNEVPAPVAPAPAPHPVASKTARKRAEEWSARVEAEGLHTGLMVTATRVITDRYDYVLHRWEEPAVIVEIRAFDAVVRFQDGTTKSSGLGLRPFQLPTP
jgi:hypothetical protein